MMELIIGLLIQKEILKKKSRYLNLCKNKDDGSYVLLHGLGGKIRKY